MNGNSHLNGIVKYSCKQVIVFWIYKVSKFLDEERFFLKMLLSILFFKVKCFSSSELLKTRHALANAPDGLKLVKFFYNLLPWRNLNIFGFYTHCFLTQYFIHIPIFSRFVYAVKTFVVIVLIDVIFKKKSSIN